MRLTSMKNVKTVQDLKDWALANYEAGASTLVECYNAKDLEESFVKNGKVDTALVRRLVGVWADREADAKNCGGW